MCLARCTLCNAKGVEVPALLQAWLLFGMLTEFFGSLVDPEDFVQGYQTFRPVDFTKDDVVREMIKTWRTDLAASLGTLLQRAERNEHLLKLAVTHVEMFDEPS